MTYPYVVQARHWLRRPTVLLLAAAVALGLAGPAAAWPSGPVSAAPALPATLPYPILFVTQVPMAGDFTTVSSTFGNQQATPQAAGRGGDLWIRYTDGSLKNLTAAAGFGGTGVLTGTKGIDVRDPSVYWDGTKVVFSMVVGAPNYQFDYQGSFFWQLYEVTGLGEGETPVITKVPHQPANFNNISPIYGSDDRIIFTSDRPRNGQPQLYPQRDEYELQPTTTGVWSLDPATGDLRLLNQAPSGDFTPSVDSFGRVIFTQWDHLQRDQEADADANATTPGQNCYYGNPVGQLPFGTFNYSDESASATYVLTDRTEVFPEPRGCRGDLLTGTNLAGHTFNQFFPWQINQDGTSGETLNHIGRHELAGYIPASITNDPNVYDYYGQVACFNPNPVANLLQIKEDPLHPGTYYAVDAPEFTSHGSGQVISLTAPVGLSADHIAVTYVTTPSTNTGYYATGHYREPLPLSDGTLVVVHTAQTGDATGTGFSSNYAFRLQVLTKGGDGFWSAGAFLTGAGGISKSFQYYDPDSLVSYSGPMWELNPVEVRARTRPPSPTSNLPQAEQQIFNQASVYPGDLQLYMRQNNLALLVSRNVTTRDDADHQQPFNLHVFGSSTVTTGTAGTIYDVAAFQIFQGDQLRGFTGGYGSTTPRDGRRVLAEPLHDAASLIANLPSAGPNFSVVVAPDGSVAAFVPANRAMTWQLLSPTGVPVVRERYWITFQPGEVRVCTSCHGLNDADQAHQPAPTNPPQALLQLLAHWKVLSTETQHVYLPAMLH
jgi:Hydrazine synthase alpha subunit middle domain/WD40-like Beta Propeller Repeat